MSRDRQARIGWVVLLAGPVIGLSHFMVVYLVAEAGCTGGGPGLRHLSVYQSGVSVVSLFGERK